MEPKEQHELYEKARKRVKQKKRLYYHFILFLLGSVFLIVLNIIFKVGEQKFGEWFKYAVAIWFFAWILHFINVFITNRFFGKDWERIETEKLIEKHSDKLEKLESSLIKSGKITPYDKLHDSDKKK